MYFDKIKKITLLLLALIVMLTLTACGKEEEGEGDLEGEENAEEEALFPSYLIGSESVTAFTAAGAPVKSVYTYTGVDEPGTLVQAYMEQMILEENGFSVVGEDYLKASAPDFAAEEGILYLSRTAADDEEYILVISVAWSGDGYTVTTSVEMKPEEPEKPSSGTAAISYVETENFIKGLSPAELGLSGESMEEYNFYIMDGLSQVDGVLCRCFKVYRVDENTKTNIYQGTYFVSGDGKRLYIQDPNRVVTEITPN